MTEHSPVGPSAAPIWAHCAASVTLQQRYPDTGDDEKAREGNAAHYAMAELLKGGTWPTGAFDQVPFSEEMRRFVEPAVEYVNRIPPVGSSRYIEQKLGMPGVHPTAFGTVDVGAISYENRTAYVFDLKYGRSPVREVWQLVMYANGLFETLNVDNIASWSIELHILQPRVWHPEGPYRVTRLSYPAYANHVRHLRGQAEEALGKAPDAIPGPWCKHCSARAVCSALRAENLDNISVIAKATPVDLPPDALGMELALFERMESLLSARLTGLRAQVEHLIRGGESVPGWGMQTAPGREEWVKAAAEIFMVGELMGIDLAKPRDPITPNQARTAGVPPDVVAAYSQRRPGSAKLTQITNADATRAFGPATTE